MLKIIALVGLLLGVSVSDAFAVCYSHAAISRKSVGEIVVRSGEKCPMYLFTLVNGTVSQMRIARRPQHGTVSISDGHTITYESHKGYTGNDGFELALNGTDLTNRAVRAEVKFNVKVTP